MNGTIKTAFGLGGALVLTSALAGGTAFRPPAVPLVCVEPHFSVWSAADRLTDSETTHWSGVDQPISVILTADGVDYRLCGRSPMNVSPLPQVGVVVRANETVYTFAKAGLAAEVCFWTPRLTDDLDIYSRPVSYVTVKVSGAKSWQVKMTCSKALATNDDGAAVVESRTTVAGLPAVTFAREEQKPFSIVGDRKRANWGRVWCVGPSVGADEVHYLLAYENGKSVRYFGQDLVDWWQRDGKTIEAVLGEAERDHARLHEKVRAFDAALAERARAAGGEKYAQIVGLAWRQSFAACKFVAAPNGEPYMFSNENGSGGMIGTVDVLYPQLPHLLFAGAPFVKATLAPVCEYAASTNWPYAYAPHDLGLFPVAEGQYYGMKRGQSVGGGADDSSRMPVEECGNMLLSLAALARLEGNAAFAGRWWPTVTGWSEYLLRVGFDPENQLCTDDFAGHLAHNANLSVKTILALAAYGMMAEMRGDDATAAEYRRRAADMVPKWIEAAKGGRDGSYRLAFDRPGTWSMKYNLVWDRLLGFNLFPPAVAEAEVAAYRKIARDFRYGLPLDCRKAYTKSDWMVWCGTLTGRKQDLEALVAPYYDFLNESPDRVPGADWYEADCGLSRQFAARSVIGGVFLPLVLK